MEISKELWREIMLDRYENPKNKLDNSDDEKMAAKEAASAKKLVKQGYAMGHNDSPSCIDNIDGFVLIKKGKIADVKFSGNACTICKSSTDLAASTLVGMSIKQAKDFLHNYYNMILKKPHDKKKLGYMVIYSTVNEQANRVKCALTGVQALEKAIDNYENK